MISLYQNGSLIFFTHNISGNGIDGKRGVVIHNRMLMHSFY